MVKLVILDNKKSVEYIGNSVDDVVAKYNSTKEIVRPRRRREKNEIKIEEFDNGKH